MVRRAKGEGSIRYDNKHDRYIWRLKFLGEDGLKHEKYLTAKTKKGLQEKIKEYQSKKELNISDVKLADWSSNWLTVIKPTIKISTYDYYDMFLRNYINPNLGEKKVQELTPIMLQEFFNQMVGENGKKGRALSATTINGMRRTLKTCLEYAVKNGVIRMNPAATTKPLKKADKKENTYQITVDTQQMQLYTAMEPIYDEKLADYLKDNSVVSDQYIEDVYSLMLEAYQTALDKAEYNDPESVTVTLQKDDSEQWSISSDDMTTLKNALIDLASLNPSADGTTGTPAQVTAEDIANSQSEGAPNMEYPKDLESTPAYKVGDAITIQSDGKDVATFTIDKVEVTDDRSEYDTSNPDKVIVITYTYKNLAFDDPLLYDQMSFRVLDGDTVCLPYYLADLTSPDLATTGGDAVTATAAYGISASCNEVTIYVDGAQIAFPFQVSASVS